MIKDLERTDDFFDLGGDSIRATQIAGKLRSSLDIPVDIVDLFQHSNVADLAEYLTGRH